VNPILGPLVKVSQSTTALVGAGLTVVNALSQAHGWNIDPRLLAVLGLAFGLKEGAGKIANSMSREPSTKKPKKKATKAS
jgi:hypothetical protein